MANFSFAGTLETDDGSQDWSAMRTRLNSFQAFPHAQKLSAERLARAGFYFTGQSDRVRCFSCQKTVENWHQGDTPVERHREVSPACRFLSCAHRRNLSNGHSSETSGSAYDEEAEDIEFRLRTGEVVDESPYPMVPHMKSEEARLRTFNNWPSWSPVQPNDLVQAGLFYVPETDRENDLVQCFCCGGMLSGWEEGDDPWSEHAKFYRNCFFILGHDVGNIPSELVRQGGSGNRSSMETFEGRLDSFRDRQHPISHERLARAGFYSTGERDRVICFKCGGGLKDWQPNEDPWEEHARHYPGCSFLLAEKGQEFVNSVQLSNPRGHHPNASNENGFSSHERASNVMQSEIAQKAVEMGFDPTKVERTILEKIRQSSKGYSKVEDLIQDITSNVFDSEEAKIEDPLKKLEKLQREKLCKVCMDNDISIVFIPCGHLVTCQRCSESVEKCPICCAVITQKIKTYSS
ncbi:E3 ubiquitin-protein ligase XIAP [Salminus brasiliensis]|uniref:E3 ubiquitin-protein ligase XIAP n=1 Tax=Salminus brasiliensis TaxID=930266 RepID=UPI003B831CF8